MLEESLANLLLSMVATHLKQLLFESHQEMVSIVVTETRTENSITRAIIIFSFVAVVFSSGEAGRIMKEGKSPNKSLRFPNIDGSKHSSSRSREKVNMSPEC